MKLLSFIIFLQIELIAVSANSQTRFFFDNTLDSIAKQIKLPDNINLLLPDDCYTAIASKFKLTPSSNKCFPDDHDGNLFEPKALSPIPKIMAHYIVKANFKQFKFLSDLSIDSIRVQIVKDSTIPLRRIVKINRSAQQKYDNIIVNDSTILLPKSWKGKINPASVKSIWFKCETSIDISGNPIYKSEYIEPIFLETQNGNFRISIVDRIDTHDVAYEYVMLINPFTKTVLNGCKLNDPAFNQFLDTLKNRIISKLKGEPFLAKLYTDITVPENEIWLKREEESSIVLNSSYIYERSTYMVSWDIVKFSEMLGLKFYVKQSLTLCVGKGGKFSDPDPSQRNIYENKINTTIGSCVSEVCNEFKNVFLNNSCKCN